VQQQANKAERNRTTTGGRPKGLFPTTQWTDILEARSGDESCREAALGELLTRYWKPVYYYVRSKGRSPDEAKDLTQGFFQQVVLGRGLVQKAERARGRFRTFILTALNRYMTSVHRVERAKRRMPEGGLISLDGIEALNLLEPVCHPTASDAFDYAWASAILDQVLAEVAARCRAMGRNTYWEVFRIKVLAPILDNTEAPPLAEICAKFGVANEARASKMIFDVKRFFRDVMKNRIGQLVNSDDEVNDEIQYLMRVLSRSSRRS
jgi:DNA-directed RNA polymerase specialized sigma24 family protein